MDKEALLSKFNSRFSSVIISPLACRAAVKSSASTPARCLVTDNFLNDSNLSITEIVDEMKFTSVSYSFRYCVKHISMSPSEYHMVNSSES